MGENWDLNAMYASFYCNEINEDTERLKRLIEEITIWNKENLCYSQEKNYTIKIEEYIDKINIVNELEQKLHQYCHLTLATDVNNKKAFDLAENLQTFMNELTIEDVKFKKWLQGIENIENYIHESSNLKEHRFFIMEKKRSSIHTLSLKEEYIISKMKNTGSKTFENLYSKLISNLMVDIKIKGESKELPLNHVKNMEFSADVFERKAAYEAQNNAYKKIEEGVAACLNGIKGEVITLSTLRGYSSPLQQTIEDSRMEMKTLDTMLEVIQENLVYFHKFYEKKAQILGYDQSLPFYDIFAPVSSNVRTYTYVEAQKFVVENFRTFSDELADYAELAFKSNWIDTEPKQGKRGGAFCSTIHPIRQSRILCNYSGKFKSVVTLAHELGHAYHGKCLFNETNINSKYGMPIAETASIFAETIVKNAAMNSAKASGNREEYINILETDLTGTAQVIVDIYSRFLFENEVFIRRRNGTLSVEELKDIMIESQKKAFGHSLDHNYLQPYAWIYKPHYYYADRNYYNYPYAFGVLFSKGLYSQYLKEGPGFYRKYAELLSSTGKMSIKEVAMTAGIDINSKEFWQNSMNIIKKEIDLFLEI